MPYCTAQLIGSGHETWHAAIMQAKRGLRLKKRAAEGRVGEDGQPGSSRGPASQEDFRPMARMSEDTRLNTMYMQLLLYGFTCIA